MRDRRKGEKGKIEIKIRVKRKEERWKKKRRMTSGIQKVNTVPKDPKTST